MKYLFAGMIVLLLFVGLTPFILAEEDPVRLDKNEVSLTVDTTIVENSVR